HVVSQPSLTLASSETRQVSVEPVREPQAGNLFEVLLVSGEQQGVIHQRDGRNLEIRATRACCWLKCSSLWKTIGKRCWKVSFQRVSREGLSWCLRHSSAWELRLLSRSRTTCALKSAVKLR